MLSALRTRSAPSVRPFVNLPVVSCCLFLVACGGSGAPAKPVAVRICDGAQGAAAATTGSPVSGAIVNRDPANLECALTGRRLQVRLVSQTSAQAYIEFDTETSHQSQVFGPGVHEPGQIPRAISVPGAVAAVWIPAQRELVATSGSPTHGGSYVTVTIRDHPGQRAAALALAQAVARATFAAHPGTSS